VTWRPISHSNYPWADSPSTSTALDADNLGSAETALWASAVLNLELLGIAATPTQTSAYSANAGDFVPVDTTSGAVTVTLPASVSDQARVGVKNIKGSHTVTVTASGGATFDYTSGATSTALAVGQSIGMQYNASGNIWHIMATTSTLTIDTTASDFQPDGTASAGSTGKIADAGHVHPTDTTRAVQLNIRTWATSAVSPSAGQFQPYDISSGSISDVLPNGPPNGTIVAVKIAKVQSSPIGSSTSAGTLNSLTIATQGSDTFSDGVSTSVTMYAAGQSKYWQYNSGPKLWYAISGDAGTTSPWCCVGVIGNMTQQTSVGYCIDSSGIVFMRGQVTTTSGIGTAQTLFILPAGLRPSHDTQPGSPLSYFDFQTGGGVHPVVFISSGTSTAFDGISFPTT